MNTDLDKLLKEKGVKTVIGCRHCEPEGAVLNTAAAAALRGYKVIVPVDGRILGEPVLREVHRLASGQLTGGQSAGHLTRIDLVGF